jgi:predicted dehydrogenase
MHNIGIVGYGSFGRFLKESWEALPNARVLFITKTNAETARQMAQRDGVSRHSGDYRDLLADPDVDIVSIVTPPYLHKKIAVEAFRAGKNVLVEKPLATDTIEVESIVTAAEESGRVGSVNMMMRYSGLIERLRELRSEGLLGGLSRVIVENYASDEGLGPDHWFWDRSKSGGILIEHGVHFFDLAGWVIGSPPIRTVGFTAEREPGIQDKVMASIAYEDGVMATYYHSFSRPSALEETSARYIFHRGEIEVIGWIPMELRLHGYVSEVELERLIELFPGSEIDTTAIPRREVVSSGVRYPVSQEATLNYVHTTDKQAEYANCVRYLMSDMTAAIEDPNHVMRVTLADGRQSVETAAAAVESADGYLEI